MLIGISASICRGYTRDDHLIDSADETAATDAVAGIEFRRAFDALEVARKAFRASCDHCRVNPNRPSVAANRTRDGHNSNSSTAEPALCLPLTGRAWREGATH